MTLVESANFLSSGSFKAFSRWPSITFTASVGVPRGAARSIDRKAHRNLIRQNAEIDHADRVPVGLQPVAQNDSSHPDRGSPRGEFVKPRRIQAENFFFRGGSDIFAAPEQSYRFRKLAVAVRVIRGVHRQIVADVANDVGQSFFVRLAGDENVAIFYVVARLL